MKILKSILVAIAVILFIALAGIYFLPSNYTITNKVKIGRPVSMVYPQVADYSKWSDWSPWREKDPDAKFTVENQAGSIGHKASWQGKQIGAGHMAITNISTNDFISHDVVFTSPMNGKAIGMLVFEEKGDSTTVTWITKGGLPYPLGRLWGLMVDEVVKADQQKGLNNLKRVCEAMPLPAMASTTQVPDSAMLASPK